MNLASSEWSICIVMFLGARYYLSSLGFQVEDRPMSQHYLSLLSASA